MINHILNAIGAAGNLLDLPGSSVRDALAGHNPFDQYMTPFHSENRLSGRDLLRHYGLAGHQDSWGNFAAGLGAEIATDPTNLIPARYLMSVMRARKAAAETNAGVKTAWAAHNEAMKTAIDNNYRHHAMTAEGHLVPSEAAKTALPDKYFMSSRTHDNFADQLAENVSESGWINMDGKTNVDRGVISLSEKEPTSAYEHAFPVRVTAQKPFHATSEWTPPDLHRIAQESRDLRSTLPDDLVLAGAQRQQVAAARQRRTLKSMVAGEQQRRHGISNVMRPTGQDVYAAVEKHSEQPIETLRRAGYDAVVQQMPWGRDLNLLSPKQVHPWDLAPEAMEIPSAAGLPRNVGVPSRKPAALGIAGYNALARSRRPKE